MKFDSRDAFPARGGVDDKPDNRFPMGGPRGAGEAAGPGEAGALPPRDPD